MSDASAAWYDEYIVILSATGAAFETFIVEGVRTDTSAISNLLSNLSAIASDIYSALTITNSRALVISNVNSMLVAGTFAVGASVTSDIASAVWAQHWTKHSLVSSFGSAFEQIYLNASNTYSLLSDLRSEFLSRVPKLVATNSQLSDLHSDLRSYLVGLSDQVSDFNSDLRSLLVTTGIALNTATVSDLKSAITAAGGGGGTTASQVWNYVAGVGRTLTSSGISDIASAVWMMKYTDASNVKPSTFGSAMRLTMSRMSDTQSFLLAMSDVLSDFYSDFQSRVPKAVATQSQLSDLHSDLRSYLVGLSDQVSDFNSDMRSLLTTTGVALNTATVSDLKSAIAAGGGAVTVSNISDIASAVWMMKYTDASNVKPSTFGSAMRLTMSRVSDTQSFLLVMSDVLSDFYSDFQSRVPKAVATQSQLSDLHSDLRSYLVGLSDQVSDFNSDMRSLLVTTGVTLNTATVSDLKSAIAAGGGTVTVSNISDIASAVWMMKYTDASNVKPSTFGSALRLNMSRISDTQSFLSDFNSDLRSLLTTTGVALNTATVSDLKSAITVAGGAVTVSNISDIASAVWTMKYTLASNVKPSTFGSALRLNMSRISDTQSFLLAMSDVLSDFYSDFQSRVPKLVATNSQVSDLSSDLKSAIAAGGGTVTVSNISDIASAVWMMKYTDASNVKPSTFGSALRLNMSRISDTQSFLSDFNSDLRSLLTTTGVALNTATVSDLKSAIAVGPTGAVTVSNISDIASAVWSAKYTVHTAGSGFGSLMRKDASGVSDIQSFLLLMSDVLSDFYSDFQSRVPKLVATNSQVSDLSSDLKSAIAAGGGTVTVSNISDIASAVWAAKYTVHTAASGFGSLLRQGASGVSDIQSFLVIMSDVLSDFYSDFQSRVPKAVATNSQVSDLMSDIRSYLLGLSDQLSDFNSDVRSLLTTTGVALNTATVSDLKSAIAAGGGAVTVSNISDIASAVWSAKYTVHTAGSGFGSLLRKDASGVSDIQSFLVIMSDVLSDFYSDFQSRVPKAVATQSQLSDLHSDLRSYLAGLSDQVSDVNSDLRSLLTTTGVALNTATVSDLKSAIAAGGGTLTVSNVSDIASAVWAANYVTHGSAATGFGSLLRKTASGTSDVQSALLVMSDVLSDFYSDFQSRVPAVVATQTQLTAVQSDVRSYLAGMSNTESDIYSLLSDLRSDFQSRVPKLVATASQVSDVVSDVRSYLVSLSGMLSATYSVAAKAQSQVLVVQSQASTIYDLLSDVSSDVGAIGGMEQDVYSLLSSLESDIQSRFPATIPELTGDPGAAPTWVHQAALQYMWLKNSSKTTVSKRFLRAASGQVVLSAALADDSGSFVQGVLAE